MVQLSLTACMFGSALGQIVVGPLSDQLGRRRPLIAGLAIYVISSLLCAWVPTIHSFVAMRFVQGLSGAAGIVIARAISRDMFSGPALTRFSATLSIIFGVAPVLGPIFGGQLIEWVHWQAVFYVLAGIAAVLLIYVLFGLKESLPKENRATGGFAQVRRNFGTLFRDRFFLGLALTQGFTVACMFAYISGSPFVLQKLHGITPQQFSLIFAVNCLGQIVLAQVCGRSAGRIPERRMIGIGISMSVSGATMVLVSVLTDAGLWLLLPGIFLPVAAIGLVNTSCYSLALNRYGQFAGTASGIIGVLSYVLSGSLSPLTGLGGGEAALPMGLVMSFAAWSAMLSFLFLVRKNQEKAAAAEQISS
jgi:DHA1 family bicyclomycin/chloramphenicol resistance-like MFS transporter